MKANGFINYVCNALIFVALCTIIILSIGGGSQTVFSEKNTPIYNGNKDSNQISLMINVYWGSEYLPKILDELDKHDVKTTFFIGGVWASKEGELLQEIVNRGHELGNHAYSHKDMSKLNYEDCRKEISNTNAIIKGITGVDVVNFTPPSGAFSQTTLSASKELGMTTFMWSKDTIDWRDKDSQIIYNRATKNIVGGDIILMHPTEKTAQVIGDILDYYDSVNLDVVPISNLIK